MIPDAGSGRPTGILVAAHQLRDSNGISMEDEEWLREYLEYFNKNLKIPKCLSLQQNRRAISWFKRRSNTIDSIWDLKVFMEEQDVFIDILSTADPGIVIYEDGHQIVARPHKNRQSEPQK